MHDVVLSTTHSSTGPMFKTTLRDVALVIALSIALGVVYNAAFSVKPLPWIRQPRHVDTADTDSLLRVLQSRHTDTATSSNTRANVVAAADTINRIPPAQSNKTPTMTAVPTEPRLPPNNDALPPPQQETVRAVTYEQVRMMLRNEDVLFLDARRRDEFESGHLPRARNVDVQLFEMDPNYRSQVMQMLYSLDKRRPVVTYCGGGNCELSHKLSELLVSIGFEHVFIYLGGWNEYSTKPDAPREQ